jgi:hypothetical protein
MRTDIIKSLLRDDKEYYNGVGKNYLSNSDIGTLLTNPKEFGVSRPDNKNFAEGRYFHQLILEPDKASDVEFVDVSTRNTKAYKEKLDECGKEILLLKSEVDDIQALVKVMTSNYSFFEKIYQEGNKFEEPAIGMIKDMMWKGKADIVATDCLIDLKTTSNIQDFKWSARKYNYDSQCYIYQQLFGKPLVFYVIDKITHQMGVFEPTADFLSRGEEKVERAIEVYNKFFSENPTENIDNYFIKDYL